MNTPNNAPDQRPSTFSEPAFTGQTTGSKQLDDQIEPMRVTSVMVSSVIHDAAYHVLPDTQITVCVITLTNGTKLLGYNYGSIDPAAQDWEQGRHAAYNMAREKICELEGYALRERLAQGSAA